MLFSQIASFFLLGLATTTYASPVAEPAPVADIAIRQSNEEAVTAVFESLKETLDPLIVQINELKAAGPVNQAEIVPVLTQVTAALDEADTALQAISPDGLALAKRQSGDPLADLVGGIVNGLLDALDGLVADLATIPILAGLLLGIDRALSSVLNSLGRLLADVLRLVAQLLRNVATLLSRLAFVLTLGSLGL